MDLVIPKNRKERKALKYGAIFLELVGISLEDLIDFRRITYENKTLIEVNTKLLNENKVLKGERNPDKAAKDDMISYLSDKNFGEEGA